MFEQWAISDRSKDAVTHVAYDLIEANRRHHRHVQSPQIFGIGVICVRADRVVGPRCWTIPAVASDADAADLRTDTLDSLEHATQLAPSKPIVADVIHTVALVSKIERHLPGRAVGMEQKRPHISSERMQRRLADLVGEAVTGSDPVPA